MYVCYILHIQTYSSSLNLPSTDDNSQVSTCYDPDPVDVAAVRAAGASQAAELATRGTGVRMSGFYEGLQPSWSRWNMISERTPTYSSYTPYSIYFRIVVSWRCSYNFHLGQMLTKHRKVLVRYDGCLLIAPGARFQVSVLTIGCSSSAGLLLT